MEISGRSVQSSDSILFFNAVSVPRRTSRCDWGSVRSFPGTKEAQGCYYTLPKDFVLNSLAGQLCGRMLSLRINHTSMWLPEETASVWHLLFSCDREGKALGNGSLKEIRQLWAAPLGVCSRSRTAQFCCLVTWDDGWALGLSQELAEPRLKNSWWRCAQDLAQRRDGCRSESTEPCACLPGVRAEEPWVSTAAVRTAPACLSSHHSPAWEEGEELRRAPPW